MTADDLDEIERAVGFSLPATYRKIAQEQPFRPTKWDAVYWFFSQPSRIIDETLCLQAKGQSVRTGWQPGYLAIGYSACGDVYILDTLSCSLPIHELSHETHEIEKSVWNSFDDFVSEWLRLPTEIEKAVEENLKSTRTEQWTRIRRGLWVVAFIFGLCPVIVLILSLFMRK